jgi:hypothetical protein
MLSAAKHLKDSTFNSERHISFSDFSERFIRRPQQIEKRALLACRLTKKITLIIFFQLITFFDKITIHRLPSPSQTPIKTKNAMQY